MKLLVMRDIERVLKYTKFIARVRFTELDLAACLRFLGGPRS